LEVGDRAAEPSVDQDGDRSRAGRLEGLRQERRVGARPEVAGRGRAPLDLGNTREAGNR
jgi:hypothetical protein